MDQIPLVDLQKQYKSIKSEVDSAIQTVLDECSFIMGPHVEEFEKAFAQECHVKHGIGASSGTTALYLALKGLGITEGDEVITVPNTFIATTESISQTGAKVVFVEIDESTYNIDVSKIEDAITDNTKAIIPVHLYGQPADMDLIRSISFQYDLRVIEDASQAHLAEYNGQRTGSFGDAACFSFYPGKNLGAYGDGGAVVTDNDDLAARIRKLSDHGRTSKYEYDIEGYNYRLDGLQAAILNVKLRHLADWTEKRRQIATWYNEILKDVDGVETPYVDDRCNPVYHLYVVRISDRDRILNALHEKGIFAGIHYPLCLHVQKAYEHLGYKEGDFPISEKCSKEIISLPIFPELTKEEVEKICNIFKDSLVAK